MNYDIVTNMAEAWIKAGYWQLPLPEDLLLASV